MSKKKTITYSGIPAWTPDSLPKGEADSSFPEQTPTGKTERRVLGVRKDAPIVQGLPETFFPTVKTVPRNIRKKSGRTFYKVVPENLQDAGRELYTLVYREKYRKDGTKYVLVGNFCITCFCDSSAEADTILRDMMQRIRNVHSGYTGYEFLDKPLPRPSVTRKERKLQERREEEERHCKHLARTMGTVEYIQSRIDKVSALPFTSLHHIEEIAEVFRRNRIAALQSAIQREQIRQHKFALQEEEF